MMRRRIKSWWLRLWNRGPSEEKNPLREFLYLDEVSVTSLLSSRRGAVPSEITETVSDSTRAESSSGFEASAKAVKANVGSVLESTHTYDRQVLRKANIQTTFRDLHKGEIERGSLVMRSVLAQVVLPPQDQIRKVIDSPAQSARSPKSTGWVVSQEQLQRGRLAEVEVELQADPVFRVSAFVSTVLDMLAESEQLAGYVDQGQAVQFKEFNQLLERLLVGLVPIKARLVDYEATVIDGEEYLVHRRMVNQLPAEERPTTRPVYLVGVAEQDLFWKDIRRVLFSKARVRVLCRLNYPGVQSSWTAVKLAHMIGEFFPGFVGSLNSLGDDVLQAMAEGEPDEPRVNDVGISVLVTYGDFLAQEGDLALDEAARFEVARLANENAHLLEGATPESRPAFNAIAEYFKEHFAFEVAPEVNHDLRERARQQDQSGENTPTDPAGAANEPASTSLNDRYLDAEIIAIYW